MKSLGPTYFDMFHLMPLRTICSDEEFLAAEIVNEHLLKKAQNGTMTEDEKEYWYVLDLLLSDYVDCLDDAEIEEVSEPEISEEVPSQEVSSDLMLSELDSLLDEKREDMQEWDFVQLCNNISTIVSTKLSELEAG